MPFTGKNLTKGSILPQILALAIPIIGSSFIQTAYNMTDVFWLGKAGSQYVTAVSTAGYIIWFSVSVIFAVKIGVEVSVAQALGRSRKDEAGDFAVNAMKLGIIISIILGLLFFFIGKNILAFYDFNDDVIVQASNSYLRIYSLAFPVSMSNFIFTGIYTGFGDSKTPFYLNSVGLVTNMLLDPFFILGVGSFNGMTATGAAYASVIAQTAVFLLFVTVSVRRYKHGLSMFFKRVHRDVEQMREIVNLGLPVALQSALFAIFAFIIAKIVVKWGAESVAVISIGANVEAVSWMTASGFATALGTFTGQNFGAKQFGRIKTAYYLTLLFSVSIGLVAAFVFFIFPDTTISIFNDETNIVKLGISYFKIVALSQIFMCLEITTTGVFNGIGQTRQPAIVGITVNGLRVFSIWFIAHYTIIGIDGAWWSISLSSVMKGIVLYIWILFIFDKIEILAERRRGNGPFFVRLIPTRIRQQLFARKLK